LDADEFVGEEDQLTASATLSNSVASRALAAQKKKEEIIMKNDYEIRGEVTAIFIYRPKHGALETLISTNKLELAKQFPNIWYPYWSEENQSFYVYGNITYERGKKKTVQLHRWVSEVPAGLFVDHKDHNTLNNVDSNLRIVTASGNCQNRNGARVDSSSGVRGVYWDKSKNRWRALCTINGQKKYLGRFKTIEEAEIAAIEGRRKYLPFSPEAG
jgi:hypothetical protein